MRWAAVLVVSAFLAGCHDGGEVGPCVFVACSGHGTCVEQDGAISCDCRDGYLPEGHRCVPAGADGDADADADLDGEGDGDLDGG